MKDVFAASYYWIDLLIGFGCPVVFYFLLRVGLFRVRSWRFYWLGVLLGATGEIPVFLISALTSSPVIIWINQLPALFWVFLIAHTLGDGLLFLAGTWLIELLCKPPVLTRFRWSEAAVLLLWGQFSSFFVEISTLLGNGWMYVPGHWWNPTLFLVAGRPVTLLPQIAWLFYPTLYYLLIIKFRNLMGEAKVLKMKDNAQTKERQ